jgi:uncharacterized protein YndB with AHSA1/START domain
VFSRVGVSQLVNPAQGNGALMADLQFIVSINADPDKVFAAVATQTGMRNWWTADAHMDEVVGGKAEFAFERRAVIFRMTIEKLDPGRCIVMKCHGDQPEWNGTTLRWDVADNQDGGATLRFVHSGWRDVTDFCSSCNAMWGNLMFRLKDSVEGKGRGPQWKE